MAGEDIQHRVDWLDEERRKDKAAIARLEERLKAQLAASESQAKQLQELGGQMANLGARLQPQKIDELLARHREETARTLEGMDKRRLDLEEKSARSRAIEKEKVEKSLAGVQKQMDGLADVREAMDTVRGEQTRQSSLLQDMRKTLDVIQRRDEERTRIIAAAEEGRRQDIRRMADIQGEQQAIRQRNGEIGPRLEAMESAAQRLDTRLSELMTMELERRNAMALWEEQQTSMAAERERLTKEWEGRVAGPVAKIEEFLKQVENYNETYRAMRRTMDSFKEMTDRQEQKLREMAEIQRIQEERLRQDWSTFLADDQKRWTAQNLIREDEWRESSRQLNKAVERIKRIEEQLEQALDTLRATQEGDRARLETLANSIRDWLGRLPPLT